MQLENTYMRGAVLLVLPSFEVLAFATSKMFFECSFCVSCMSVVK